VCICGHADDTRCRIRRFQTGEEYNCFLCICMYVCMCVSLYIPIHMHMCVCVCMRGRADGLNRSLRDQKDSDRSALFYDYVYMDVYVYTFIYMYIYMGVCM